MSLEDKFEYLLETKNAIRQAIQSKGVTVSDNDTFRSYAQKISSIQSGGIGGNIQIAQYAESNIGDGSVTISPDSGYTAMQVVVLAPVQKEDITVSRNGTFYPSEGKLLSSVTVNVRGGVDTVDSFGSAYEAQYNFNGKTIAITVLDNYDSNMTSTYSYYDIDFNNGYKARVQCGGGASISFYNPYGNEYEGTIDSYYVSMGYNNEYTFRDGEYDIGTNCTITAFSAERNGGGTDPLTASQFDSYTGIKFNILER